MVSCVKSIFATSIPQLTTQMPALGVSFPFSFLFLSFLLIQFQIAHPTLNRHSPPEVVANFKRRVPPRLPKPRKRDIQDQASIPPPRSAIGMGPVPLTVPSSVGHPSHKLIGGPMGRARGFSAPGSFTPLNQGGAAGWNTNYPRSALPPLMVPSDPPHLSQQNNMYNHSPHPLHPITPSDDTPSSNFHHLNNYSNSNPSQFSYTSEQNTWSYQNGSSSHNSSLSSLLNPSNNGYSRPQPTINTSYGSPFSSMPMQGEHSASSLSPDSRPTTGYSMSSVSSMPYHDDYSRPSSSHHRPISPSRPTSSKSNYNGSMGSLSVRRERRHSQAMSPYPSPYDHQTEQQRPSTSPQPIDSHHHHHPGSAASAGGANGNSNGLGAGGLPRVRSMIQLPSVDPYSFSNSQAEFAYSAIPGAVGHSASMESINDANGWHRNAVRPSTSTSSISAASHTSSSQANTPPVAENYHGETDINRCECFYYIFFRYFGLFSLGYRLFLLYFLFFSAMATSITCVSKDKETLGSGSVEFFFLPYISNLLNEITLSLGKFDFPVSKRVTPTCI